MPKNIVSDPITDQEMAFAHLVLSGTMNDRRAAEAVGLNPASAAYIKSKPLVRAYMVEHRAAVEARLVSQEAEGLRSLNVGRDQILNRLWELANLSPETTRGSMAGQIKAMAMIIAIEGLVPDRRTSKSAAPSTHAPLARATNATAEWPHKQQQPAGSTASVETAATKHASTSAAAHRPHPTDPTHQNERTKSTAAAPQESHTSINPFIYPEKKNRIPATAGAFDVAFDLRDFRNLPFLPAKNQSAHGR